MHASESLHCRNLRMAHYIRRNLPQICCGFTARLDTLAKRQANT